VQSLATLRTQVKKIDAALTLRRTGPNPLLARLRQDPTRILSEAKMPPDAWQTGLLRSASKRVLMLACRQSGKSTTAAALALRTALTRPDSLTLLLSPSLRQSGELFRDKVLRLYNQIGRPLPTVQESALQMTLANGSRVISLPGDEETVRGYSGAGLLVLDEAARIPDALYYSVRPMVAVSGGAVVCLTTPFGKRGWFYQEWTGTADWTRVCITASQCPRIAPGFLAEERQALGDRWFNQEYQCSFEDAIDAVFTQEHIEAAVRKDLEPLEL
jgi:hypothetical protein